MKITVLLIVLISYPLIERLINQIITVIVHRIRKEVKN